MSSRIPAIAAALCFLACSRQTPSPANVPESSTPAATASSAPIAAVAESAEPASPPPAPNPVASDGLPERAERTPDIEYVPTPQNVVDKMLEVAKLTKKDVLYDLGCGDGRIVVTAAKKYGVKAFGFDIDPQRVRESRANVEKNAVGDRVTIELKDVFKVDLTPASVVTLYLLPELNVKLIPQLEKLAPGARIVSHDFDMEGVKPLQTWTLPAPDHRPPYDKRDHHVYLWKTPLQKVKQ
jgi:SAM-dependent methyltransferase